MRFVIPINEPEEGGSQTVHILDTGSTNRTKNRQILDEYFTKMGVHRTHLKRVRKAMGFVGSSLGA